MCSLLIDSVLLGILGCEGTEPSLKLLAEFAEPAQSSPMYGPMTYIGSNLSIDNCAIFQNGGLGVAALILENNSTISTPVLNGFNSNSHAAELIDIQSGSLG
jgi:hypothetical protein